MRILHVTTFLQGGAGRIIASLALAQRHAGHKVVVAADRGEESVTEGGKDPYASYPEYVEQLARANIPCHLLTSTFKRDVALNVRAAAQLRAYVGGEGIDIAHTHAAIPSLVARLALGGPRVVPIVQTMHGWGVRKNREQSDTDIALLGLTDAVVVPSAAAGETLTGLGLRGVPVRVIPYGIEREAPQPAIDPADHGALARLRGERRRLVLCTGTIGERKNQRLLVAALADPALNDVDAVIIGDGDPAPLRRLAQDLGVAARLHLLGYRADASRYLSFVDALVLPSRNEGLPVAVLEAFRADIPVVGSAIPEIAEAIEDGRTGFLFEPERADALAGAIARALADPDREALAGAIRTPMVHGCVRYGSWSWCTSASLPATHRRRQGTGLLSQRALQVCRHRRPRPSAVR